jgi:tetratricopeptide (TPR) repeat protein
VTGWNVLRAALGFLLILSLTWAGGLWRRSGAAAAWTGLALLFGLLLLWPRLTIRPELVSYTCFIILVMASERMGRAPATRSPAWKAFLLGPAGGALVVTLFWAQCHGFAALAPAVLILSALLGPLEARWRSLAPLDKTSPRHAWLLALLSICALGFTPNGLEGLLFPLRAMGQFTGNGVDLRSTISELGPLLQSPGSLDWTIKAYLASLVWGGVWIVARWRDVGLLRIVLFLLAAVAALTSQRNIGLYAITFVLLHGVPAGRTSWLVPRLRLQAVPARAVFLSGLVLFFGSCLMWWPSIVSDDFYLHEGVGRRFGGGTNPARFPMIPVAGLQGAERYFANLDAAAFALAHAPGDIYIDGRTEAYSPALWEEYLKIKRGGDQALAILATRRVDAVCLATSNLAFRSLTHSLWNSNSWSLGRADGAGLLFVPKRRNAVALSDTVIVRGAVSKLEGEAAIGSGTRRADLHLALSRLAVLIGDVDSGEAYLSQGLEFKPGHPTLHHNLGNLLMGRKDFPGASEHFETALALNPRLAGSALNAGVCHSRLGDRETARRFFRRAIRIDPRLFEAWMNLAFTELSLGDRDAARRAVEQAGELRPRDRAVTDLQRRLGG